MTVEISLIGLSAVLLVIAFFISYLLYLVRANQHRFNKERRVMTDRHIRDLLILSKEYSRVLKKSRAWKQTAKKYCNLYKEKANV
jgi:hypothetical protein